MAAQPQTRVAVIAGIAPGFGAAIATRFAQAGYRVAGLSRGEAHARELADTLGSDYFHVACDVTQPAQVRDAVAAIVARAGAPRVLVYNPMKLVIKPFLELAPEDFHESWRTTCLGAMIVAQAILPHQLDAGGGTMIFSGATAATKGSPRFASLAAAKFGLRGLAQSLAREFGPRGIHVVHTILDGLIWGPQTQSRFASAAREKCLEPDAIAQSYLHLAGQPPSAWTHEIDLRPSVESF
jgi:NAD(P)-dependent dehydrogenase (short-subunit alcohol dehydrogenase family)